MYSYRLLRCGKNLEKTHFERVKKRLKYLSKTKKGELFRNLEKIIIIIIIFYKIIIFLYYIKK